MIARTFWTRRIEQAWRKRPLIWLSGVRRSGKTTIARMLEPTAFLNCDLPSVARRLTEPEEFYAGVAGGSVIVFDEVHRIEEPSTLLKIGADEHPAVRVLATGSSTLEATRKFRDSLAGRKTVIHLPPVLWSECGGPFGIGNLDRRLLHGGLPEPLLAKKKDPAFFSEWLDAFYARDIQELFRVRNRTGFMNLLRLLLAQSGGLVDVSALSREAGLSRPTIMAHLEALTVAHAVIPVPPYHGGTRREMLRRPKVYGFDTGFVTFVRGWDSVREDDRGILWEHLVLDELRARVEGGIVHYWKDKSGREVDFVVKRPQGRVDAFECKINPDNVDADRLKAFRSLHPKGENFVVSPRVDVAYRKRLGTLTVTCGTPAALLDLGKDEDHLPRSRGDRREGRT